MNGPYVKYSGLDRTESMIRAVSSDTLDESAQVNNYARYWHGNLVIMKPLLFLWNMSDIRVMNMCVQFFLLIFICAELFKAGGYKLLIPFAFAVMTLNPVSMAMSLQYSDMYYITLAGMFAVLYNQNKKAAWKIFLWIGISTAYFDFLTYPVLGLGINLLLLIQLNMKDSLIAQLKRIFGCSLTWGAGYLLMWGGKWIVGSVLTGKNVIANAINSVNYRTSGEVPWRNDEDASVFEVIIKIVKVLGRSYYFIFGAAILAFLIFVLVSGGFRVRFKKLLPIIIVGLYPFAWYVLVRNHSIVHSFFTYRNLAITVMAGFIFIFGLDYRRPWRVMMHRWHKNE